MKFTEITPAKFRQYAKNSPYHSFMQTPEIATYREHNGWKAQYFAVVEDESKTAKTSKTSKNTKNTKNGKSEPKILAASLVVSKPTFLGYSIFYAPGGPLLDLENTKLTNFFFSHLINYAKSHKGYTLRIDPYYELIERDRNGAIIPNGFNHEKALKNLTKLGFRPVSSTQPKYLFATPVGQQSPDELLKHIKHDSRNTFRNIQKAERMGVKIRELKREELSVLKDITASTAERRNFHDLPLSYYEQMYDLFYPRDEVKFLVAEADVDGKITPMSAVMFMLYGDEIISLFGGNDDKYMKTHSAQFLLQWHMIKYAIDHGFKRYNHYGINALPTPGDDNFGLYNFKRGFGGTVLELIGTFEFPLNNSIYHLHHFPAKLKNLLHH